MHRSLTFRAIVCLSSLAPATLLYAAPDPQVEALKQELMELKQRYEAQQNALLVLEQRVRQVEEAPATPAPKRLTKSPAETPRSGQTVAAGAPGTTGADQYFEPVQPLLAVLSIGLLAWAFVKRATSEDNCPVPGR